MCRYYMHIQSGTDLLTDLLTDILRSVCPHRESRVDIIIQIGPVFAILAGTDANGNGNGNGDYDPKVILS